MHDFNSFVTLTYDDDHVPADLSLHYEDYQLFMKRVRRRFASARVRFYMCGEYGELFGRPHFHSCLFGLDFPDKVYCSTSPTGMRLFRSPVLEQLWPQGFSSIGQVTFESAAYVARYCMKKITGDLAESHYQGRMPEFTHMSLKPGIGRAWLEKWCSDVYPRGRVVVRGAEANPPRYYDELYKQWDPDGYARVELQRYLEHLARDVGEQSDGRLRVREQVAEARSQLSKRTIL